MQFAEIRYEQVPSKLKLNKHMKFTEAKLEQAFTTLLAKEGYPHFLGDSIERNPIIGLPESEVLIEGDLRKYQLICCNKMKY